jgi:pimeloyl-ACP methyl ester carboxylesterase
LDRCRTLLRTSPSSQLAAAEGSQFRSLIFLSPVFDTAEISRRSFAEQCHGQAVFVMTGERDDRVPLDYVSGNIAEMARAGVAARLKTVSDADHFLVFSHRALVIDSLDAWLQENFGGK